MDGYTAQYQRIAPQAYFQVPNGDVCPIINLVAIITANVTNEKIVDAITGKRIMVVGGTILSDSTLVVVDFLNGSGGGIRKRVAAQDRSLAGDPNIPLVRGDPKTNSFETNTGVALYANSVGVQCVASINYIVYQPPGI